MMRYTVAIACILGFLGVALGAFGAHGLSEVLTEKGTTETFRTATLYHLVHALFLFQLGIGAGSHADKWTKAAILCAFFGLLIFCGTLYLLSVTGIKWLGAITPIGGVGFLCAWLFAGISAYKKSIGA